MEIKIPGGVLIPTLDFKLEGDKILDLIVSDSKDKSTWKTPMKISNLVFKINDAYPNIFLKSSHEIETLTVSGTY